jgi:hypothetical protein
MSTRASADARGFKDSNASIRFQVPQPSCRSQAGKTSTHNRKIDFFGYG